MKNIIKWSSFLFVFFLTSGLNVLGFAQTFQTSDFSGNWYAYSVEVNPNIQAVYWFWGNTNVDESGDVSGTFYGPDGSGMAVSGGQITLDSKGVVSGYFSASGSTSTIVHGKMDPSKTKGTGVSVGSDGTMDLLTFIKGGGTFTSSDIQGSWYQYVMVIDPTTSAVYWAYGLLNIDGSGNATGDFIGADGSTVSVNGKLSLNSSGIMAGDATLLTNGFSSTQTIVHGKLDQSKTSGTYVSISTDKSDNSMNIGYLVKSGGVFKQSDIQGNWYAYAMNIDYMQQQVYWVYGKFKVGASGNATGSFTAPTGDTVTVTGGLNLDSDGVSAGDTFYLYEGTTLIDTLIGSQIKMDVGKTFMDGVWISPTSFGMTIGTLIKESNLVLPAIPLLLLDE